MFVVILVVRLHKGLFQIIKESTNSQQHVPTVEFLFHRALPILNEKQDEIVALLAEAIYLQHKGIITGVYVSLCKAGTGKTFLINLVAIMTMLAFFQTSDHPIMRAAPTGSAARGIARNTIHKLFSIPVTSKNSHYIDELSDVA